MPVADKEILLKHYSQPHVLKAIVETSKNKEVVGSFGGKGYAKRPASIMFERDIINLVKQGVTSFHASEETWKNPYDLLVGQEIEFNNDLRIGWDLIIDIDCPVFEYSRIAAHLIVQALDFLGIKSLSCKFSGNKGFHIGVPFEAFPDMIHAKPTAKLFPEVPRKIAEYISEYIDPKQGDIRKESLSGQIIAYEIEQGASSQEVNSIIAQRVQKKPEEILNDQLRLYASSFLEIDTIALSSRHLIRHVYSINEKSGLVSIPINPYKVLDFKRDIGDVNNFVKSRYTFLDRKNASRSEANKLLEGAYGASVDINEMTLLVENEDKQEVVQREYEQLDEPVGEEFFPPSIKQILEGLTDGRKRALFVLINFLRFMNWDQQRIIDRIEEWNKQHATPLKAVIWKTQVKSSFNKKPVLPPNFSHKGYYQELEIDTSTETKAGYRNPVTYALRSYRFANPQQKKKTEADTITPEQREMRRLHRAKKREEKKQKDSNSNNAEIVL